MLGSVTALARTLPVALVCLLLAPPVFASAAPPPATAAEIQMMGLNNYGQQLLRDLERVHSRTGSSRPAQECRAPQEGAPEVPGWEVEGLPAIAAMRDSIQAAYKNSQVAWVGRLGPVESMQPGIDYPQIYIRDLALMLPSLRFSYGDRWARPALEEFLATQYDPERLVIAEPTWAESPGIGAISGTIGWDVRPTKASVTSDEETSLISAAYIHFLGTGKAWLGHQIGGRSVLARLNLAMDWLLKRRWWQEGGLVIRGYTVDWGDVKVEGGANPTVLDAGRDQWIAGLYDQAATYRALRELAQMNRAVGYTTRADELDRRAEALQQAAYQHLWHPGGYFRQHVHPTWTRHDFPEDRIVGVTNAVAVVNGLADERDFAAIFAALEAARLDAGADRPGVSVWPPFPRDFFASHFMLPRLYQNGAVWDQWGAEVIRAEFIAGYSRLALAHLAQVAHDWCEHPGEIGEWQVPGEDGINGTNYHATSAGTIERAIIEGLFGAQLWPDRFSIATRLGDRGGSLALRVPPLGPTLRLQQDWADGSLTLRYLTTGVATGTVSLTLPAGYSFDHALFDGEPHPAWVRSVGDDFVVELGEVPGGSHTVTVVVVKS